MTTNYAQLVDYQVSQMKTNERKSFDELYEEYRAMSLPEQLTNLKELGRQLVSQIDKIIDKLDVVLEDEEYTPQYDINDESNHMPFSVNNARKSDEQSKDNEFEITVDPLTHKVLYNTELKQYKVIKRYD